jgi:hypothetical protein
VLLCNCIGRSPPQGGESQFRSRDPLFIGRHPTRGFQLHQRSTQSDFHCCRSPSSIAMHIGSFAAACSARAAFFKSTEQPIDVCSCDQGSSGRRDGPLDPAQYEEGTGGRKGTVYDVQVMFALLVMLMAVMMMPIFLMHMGFRFEKRSESPWSKAPPRK